MPKYRLGSFGFRQRSGEIHWNRVFELHEALNNNAAEAEVASMLQSCLDSITFSQVSSSDLKMKSYAETCKLIQTLQFTIEYLLHSQESLSRALSDQQALNDAQLRKISKLYRRLEECAASAESSKRQLNVVMKSISQARLGFPSNFGSHVMAVHDPLFRSHQKSEESIDAVTVQMIETLVKREEDSHTLFRSIIEQQSDKFLVELRNCVSRINSASGAPFHSQTEHEELSQRSFRDSDTDTGSVQRVVAEVDRRIDDRVRKFEAMLEDQKRAQVVEQSTFRADRQALELRAAALQSEVENLRHTNENAVQMNDRLSKTVRKARSMWLRVFVVTIARAIRRRKGLFFSHWVRMIQSLRAEEQLAKASHELEARSAAAQQRERAAEDKLQQERQRLMIETARYNTLLRKFDRNCAALSELQQQMQQQHVEQRTDAEVMTSFADLSSILSAAPGLQLLQQQPDQHQMGRTETGTDAMPWQEQTPPVPSVLVGGAAGAVVHPPVSQYVSRFLASGAFSDESEEAYLNRIARRAVSAQLGGNDAAVMTTLAHEISERLANSK